MASNNGNNSSGGGITQEEMQQLIQVSVQAAITAVMVNIP